MAIKDVLKKKDKIKDDAATTPASAPAPAQQAPHPEFKFIRSTTDMQEIITPPSFPAEENASSNNTSHLSVDQDSSKRESKRGVFHFRRTSRNVSPPRDDATSANATSPSPSPSSLPSGGKNDERRLSRRIEEKLHIHSRSRSRATSGASAHVPEDLPAIEKPGAEDPEAEAQWEKRALLLASKNDRSRPSTPNPEGGTVGGLDGNANSAPSLTPERPKHTRKISDPDGDVTIQEAIRLHEAGGDSLPRSTVMFRKLADPQGENNALAQVLYGLALRHGWGCDVDAKAALTYLSLAASNSALVESAALSDGALKGGAAKGELVLAIFELGNSFRHGWGCDKDPVAARQYYETAANLGDTDAMNEVAWCYLQGFGGKKDKFRAAQYLQMAEKKGVSEPGNSWIWKDKYVNTQASKS